jgi:hypothetical protein
VSQRQQQNVNVSPGAGIAVVGVWLAAAAVTIMGGLIVFVWTEQPTCEQLANENAGSGVLLLLLLLALPLVAAYFATMRILGHQDQ